MKSTRDPWKRFLVRLRSCLNPNQPVIRLMRAGIFLLAAIYFLYDCYRLQSNPLISSIHTAVLVLITELVIHVLFGSPGKLFEDIRRLLIPLFSTLAKILTRVNRMEQKLEEIVDLLHAKSCTGGIRGVINRIDFGLILDQLRPGETLSILDTYIPQFERYHSKFVDAIIRGVKFRILILDPASNGVQARQEEITEPLCIPIHTFEDNLNRYTSFISRVIRETTMAHPNAVQARFYSGLPCVPLYLIQNKRGQPRRAYQSLFLCEASCYIPHIDWVDSVTDGFLMRFHNYIQVKWEFNVGNDVNHHNRAA